MLSTQQGQATFSAPIPAFITFQYSEVGLIVLRIQKEGDRERERERERQEFVENAFWIIFCNH